MKQITPKLTSWKESAFIILYSVCSQYCGSRLAGWLSVLSFMRLHSSCLDVGWLIMAHSQDGCWPEASIPHYRDLYRCTWKSSQHGSQLPYSKWSKRESKEEATVLFTVSYTITVATFSLWHQSVPLLWDGTTQRGAHQAVILGAMLKPVYHTFLKQDTWAHPRVSEEVEGARICISNRFLSDVNAAGPCSLVWEPPF